MKDKDLEKNGSTTDASDTSKVSGIAQTITADVPTSDWPLKRLQRYAEAAHSECDSLKEQALGLSRRSTVQVYRMGKALCLIQDRLKKDAGWRSWLKTVGISSTSAWEAMQLAEKAAESELSGLSITQAKRKLGIVRQRKVKAWLPQTASTVQRADEPVGKAFSDEAATSPLNDELSPPKEDPKSPLGRLVAIGNMMGYALKDMMQIDWHREPATNYRTAIAIIMQTASEMSQYITNDPGAANAAA